MTKHNAQGSHMHITKAEVLDIVAERCAAGSFGGVTDRIHAENIQRAALSKLFLSGGFQILKL